MKQLLHAVFGLDWLGTRDILAEPTFVAGFGYVRIGLARYVPILAAMMPFLALLGLIIVPGIVQVMSKVWGGQATWEQTVTTLTFATVVPNIVIGGTSEWLFGVPIDLLTGHGYWWNAARRGAFGPVIGTTWNIYMYVVYLGAQWVWMIVLNTIAIRQIEALRYE